MQREITYITSMSPPVECVYKKFRDCPLFSSEVEMMARTHRDTWRDRLINLFLGACAAGGKPIQHDSVDPSFFHPHKYIKSRTDGWFS